MTGWTIANTCSWPLAAVLVLAAGGCSSDDAPRRRPFEEHLNSDNTGAGMGGGPITSSDNAGFTQSDFGNPMEAARDVNPGFVSEMGDCRTPTVLFVIDGSGSMCAPFGGSTRWTELRNVLVDPQAGLISRLDSRGDFGMLLYDGSIDIGLAGMSTGGSPSPDCAGFGSFGRGGNAQECMQVREVQPAGRNADAIRGMFPAQQLGGSTPTDRAMNMAVDQLIASSQGKDLEQNPPYIILATDGQPNDICIGGAGGDGSSQQAGVIAAVDRGVQSGITTFVISLADGDPGLEAHLAEVAKHGNPADPAAVPFSPVNPDQLNQALLAVLSTAFGCAVQ